MRPRVQGGRAGSAEPRRTATACATRRSPATTPGATRCGWPTTTWGWGGERPRNPRPLRRRVPLRRLPDREPHLQLDAQPGRGLRPPDHGPGRRGPGPGARARPESRGNRSEEHTSELQSRENLVCRLLLEKKKTNMTPTPADCAGSTRLLTEAY